MANAGAEQGLQQSKSDKAERDSPQMERYKAGQDTPQMERDEAEQDAHHMEKDEVERYCRQMVLDGFGGADGQARLRAARVLIVGAGGLGCPAALYLAGAGVGTLGLADSDSVDASNLHRQVAHATARVGMAKTASLASALAALNPHVAVEHHPRLDAGNVDAVVAQYAVVLDATDNVLSRYVLNDACCRAGRPLVSGAALGWDGQVATYAASWRVPGPARGPCMRCVLPVPPPTHAVGSCEAAGVLGPVPGVVGTLQATEALRILLFPDERPAYAGRMLFYAGRTGAFRLATLRPRSLGCPSCGDSPARCDYAALCGASCASVSAEPLPAAQRISVSELAERMRRGPLVLVDVRPASFSALHALPGALRIPVAALPARVSEVAAAAAAARVPAVVCVCRRGNESQRAVRVLEAAGVRAVDVIGGMHAYAREVDATVPII